MKVDYSRQIIIEYLDKYELKLSEYKEYKVSDFTSWIEKIKDIKGVKIDIQITSESSGGCAGEYDVVYLSPMIKREENDEEYNKRIKREEEEYQKEEERIRLSKEKYDEYLKDMKEIERIKNKYGLTEI